MCNKSGKFSSEIGKQSERLGIKMAKLFPRLGRADEQIKLPIIISCCRCLTDLSLTGQSGISLVK